MKLLLDYLPFLRFFKRKSVSYIGYTSDERSTIIYSQILTLTIILFIINLIQDVFTESISIWGVDLLMTLIVLLLLLGLVKYDLVSKVLGFLFINLALLYFTVITENKTQVSTIFFSAVACAFLVFGSSRFWLGFAFSVLSFLLIAGFEIYSASLLTHSMAVPKHDLNGTLINLFSAYCMVILSMIVLTKINGVYESNLLEEKKKIQEANEELDRFVYSMSHDLRAPLASIKGLVQIAQREKDTEQLIQYFPLIEDRVQKLESFTEDITNFTRNNSTEINRGIINLSEAIKESWNSLQYSEGFAMIKLMLNFSDQQTLLMDRIRLKIILNNLLSNAIKYQNYSKPTNERFLKINFQETELVYKFTFEDNGIGIQEDQQTQMFTMFHRATTQAQGSGLGLFIVKQITEKLGGSIELISSQGKGSSFILAFGKMNFNSEA